MSILSVSQLIQLKVSIMCLLDTRHSLVSARGKIVKGRHNLYPQTRVYMFMIRQSIYKGSLCLRM